MSTSAIQYAPGTPSISDFMDVDNIFEQFFNNDGASSTDNESSKTPSSTHTTPPSDPPSVHSLKSSGHSPVPSPQVPTLPYFDEVQMENLWDSFALDDSSRGFRGSTSQAGDGQIFYTTAGIASIPAMTPRTSVASLPAIATIQPNQVIHEPSPPQFCNPQKFQEMDKATIHSPLATLVQEYHATNTQAVHGQVTPVDDNQQTVPVFPPEIFNQESLVGRLNSPPESRRGSISPQQSQASRRSRKNSRTSSTVDEASVQEAKRRRFLERNRVAASKCRQKKKEWMQNLEETARTAQTSSKFLQATVSQLKDELLMLKQELLKHHGCDCSKIRTYLMQEAEKVVVDQQKKNTAILENRIPAKARQLSIAGSEISEISDMNTLVDDLDLLADDVLDDIVETKPQVSV